MLSCNLNQFGVRLEIKLDELRPKSSNGLPDCCLCNLVW